MNAKKESFSDQGRRKATDTWTLENNYRVKVYTYHDRAKRVYWSVITECQVEASGSSGIFFERSRPQVDLNQLIEATAASRYSYAKMMDQHKLAIAKAGELITRLLSEHQVEEVA